MQPNEIAVGLSTGKELIGSLLHTDEDSIILEVTAVYGVPGVSNRVEVIYYLYNIEQKHIVYIKKRKQ